MKADVLILIILGVFFLVGLFIFIKRKPKSTDTGSGSGGGSTSGPTEPTDKGPGQNDELTRDPGR